MIHKISFAYLRTFNIKISQILLCKTFLFGYVSVIQSIFSIFNYNYFKGIWTNTFWPSFFKRWSIFKNFDFDRKPEKSQNRKVVKRFKFCVLSRFFTQMGIIFGCQTMCNKFAIGSVTCFRIFFRRGRLNFNRFTTSSGRKNKLCIYAGSDHKTLTK